MHLSGLDIVIISVIGLSILTGLFRGFIKELMAICIWGAAFFLAAFYTTKVALLLQPFISDATVRKILAFVIILLGTLILGGLCNALLSFMLNKTGLNGTDRILGMGFGFIRGVLIVALLILVAQMTSLPYQAYAQSSNLYHKFDPIVTWMKQWVPSFLTQIKKVDPVLSEPNKVSDNLKNNINNSLGNSSSMELIKDL